MEKKTILISNDDGIHAPGLRAIVDGLQGLGDIFVAAPDRQRSASSQLLTLDNPLVATPQGFSGATQAWSINGSPADCVKIAINTLLPRKPDLVVSGINLGQNTSASIIYSGTVGAAYQGALVGIPSVALSLANFDLTADCTAAAIFGKKIAEKVLAMRDFPSDHILNVNIPKAKYEDIKGVLITDISRSIWHDNYEKQVSPYGREYYWFSGEYEINDDRLECDDNCIKENYVSITPIKFELTNSSIIEKLRDQFIL